MSRMVDITGKKFGKWKVVSIYGKINGRYSYNCICECGEKGIIRASSLKSGNSKSCGKCSHGMSNTRIYHIWEAIKQRCLNSNDINFKNYGARGIKVCDEWIESFEVFYKWSIENGYSDNLTIDRIDVNGNYEPSNCRWLSAKSQQNNRRNNLYIDLYGERKTLAEWCEILNLKYITIQKRISRGWNVEEAIFGKEPMTTKQKQQWILKNIKKHGGIRK